MSSSIAVAAVSLQFLGNTLYYLAFGLSFLESLAFIGLVIPSTTFLIAFGFLAYWDLAQGGIMFVAVVFGGFLGDVVSFFVGRNGMRWFKPGNKIFKLEYLQRGERFFANHGAKSVLFARFVSPLRPVIPFVAGLLGMSFGRFAVYAGVGGTLSTTAYFAAGYALGVVSSRSVPYVSRFELTCLAAAVLLAGGIYFRRFLLKKGEALFADARTFVAVVIGRLMRTAPFSSLLERHRRAALWLSARPHRSGALIAMVGCIVLLAALLSAPFMRSWLDSVAVQSFDIPVVSYAFLGRGALLTRGARVLTMLASPYAIIAEVAVWAVYLVVKRRFRTAGIFSLTVAGASFAVVLVKYIVARPRPDAVLAAYSESLSSFPSYHAALALVVAFFSAYLIGSIFKTWRAKVNAWLIAGAGTVGIGMTRVYLGVHYPTDVLFGYVFGCGAFLIGLGLDLALARRYLDKPPQNG